MTPVQPLGAGPHDEAVARAWYGTPRMPNTDDAALPVSARDADTCPGARRHRRANAMPTGVVQPFRVSLARGAISVTPAGRSKRFV